MIGVVARSMKIGGTDVLGRSPAPYLLTQADMDKVLTQLDKYRANAQNIIANPYGEFASAYARGEIIAAFPDWPPTAATAQAGGVPVKTRAGARSDLVHGQLFISSESTPSDATYAFLNEAVSETTQYDVAKALAIAPVNQAALDRLVTEGPAWSSYKDVDAVLRLPPPLRPFRQNPHVPHASPMAQPMGEVQSQLAESAKPEHDARQVR